MPAGGERKGKGRVCNLLSLKLHFGIYCCYLSGIKYIPFEDYFREYLQGVERPWMNRLAGLCGWEHLSHMVVQYHFCSQMKSPCFGWYSWFTNGCFPQVMRWLTSFVSQGSWWFLSSLPVIYLPFITFNLWTLSVSIKHFGIIWTKIF